MTILVNKHFPHLTITSQALEQAQAQAAQLNMTEEELGTAAEYAQTREDESIPRDFTPEQVNKVMRFAEIFDSVAEQTVDLILENDQTKARDPANYKYEAYTEGPVPQTVNAEAAQTVVIPALETLAIAKQIENAKAQAKQRGVNERTVLIDVLKNIFTQKYGENVTVAVKSITEEGKPYNVTAYKGVSKEIISGRNNYTQKEMIVISQISSIIENAEYLASRKPESTNDRVVRFDYFKTKTKIGSKKYDVYFDVEVSKGLNKYYTHRINQMELKENAGSGAEVEGVQFTPATTQNPGSDTIIPNPAQNVNGDLSTGLGANGEYVIPGETGAAEYELPPAAQTQETRTQAAETEYQMPGEAAGDYLLPEDLAPEPIPQTRVADKPAKTALPGRGAAATADGMRPDIVKNLPAAAAYTAKNADTLDHAVKQAERLVFGTFAIPQSEKANVRTELKTNKTSENTGPKNKEKPHNNAVFQWSE